MYDLFLNYVLIVFKTMLLKVVRVCSMFIFNFDSRVKFLVIVISDNLLVIVISINLLVIVIPSHYYYIDTKK